MVQISTPKTFGNTLQFLRKKSRDPLKSGILSQERLSELIAEKTDKPCSRNDVGDWERNESTIRHNNRELLVALVSVLVQCGGIETVDEADNFLTMGDYRRLNEKEIHKLSEWAEKELVKKDLPDKNELQSAKKTAKRPPTISSRNENIPFLAPVLPPQRIFGRDDALMQIARLLAFDTEETIGVPPVALRGMGGIGKTTLAIAFAHNSAFQSLFRDGVLWTSLGQRPTIRLHQNTWGRVLGVDLMPERDETACCDRLRAALYQREMLLIVDDVWETTHGTPFLVGGPRCRTVFTTRELSVANDLATRDRALRVDVLKPEPSLALLRELAPEAVTSDEKSAKRLCERLEFLPLGLTLAGRLLANEADIPSRMKRLVDELIEQRDARLQLLQSEGRKDLSEESPVSLQSILGLSVKRLGKIDQERFAMVSVFGCEPLTWDIEGAASVWECTSQQAEDTVARFIQRGLVEQRGDHYWMHALLADYAAYMRNKMGL